MTQIVTILSTQPHAHTRGWYRALESTVDRLPGKQALLLRNPHEHKEPRQFRMLLDTLTLSTVTVFNLHGWDYSEHNTLALLCGAYWGLPYPGGLFIVSPEPVPQFLDCQCRDFAEVHQALRYLRH